MGQATAFSFDILKQLIILLIAEERSRQSVACYLFGGRGNGIFPFVYSVDHIPFAIILISLFYINLIDIFMNTTYKWMVIVAHHFL